MLRMLKNHPFAVSAHFERSVVLTFAVPHHHVAPLLPPPLLADLYNDEWAFVAAAMVDTKALRPKGFPAFLGSDFFLAGYRIFVRYTTSNGKRLRGLYILGSMTNKAKMVFLGNLFTHYHYRRTDVSWRTEGNETCIRSNGSNIDVRVRADENPILPPGSPFAEWKDARRFAGPLPFTFTWDAIRSEILIIEGVREHWQPAPATVISSRVGFIEELALPGTTLASAFVVSDIPYEWKKGRIDTWKP
jgi:hypothetical protein